MRNYLCIITLIAVSVAQGSALSSSALPAMTGSNDLRPDSIPKAVNLSDTITDSDSIHRLLPGVEVEGEKILYVGNKVVYKPTKYEKNASTDAMDLLHRMTIPQLTSTSTGITTLSGHELSYFVNGHPASDDELKGMFMKNVKTVEYLEFPADPKYLGKPFVVDFKVQEYEYGGYTKIGYNHDWMSKCHINTGTLFSKFAYKRMTFDLSTNPYHIRRNDYKTESDGIFHPGNDAVIRHANTDYSKYVATMIPVKFRAIYSHGQTYLSNTFGFQYWDNTNDENGTVSFSSRENQNYDYTKSRPNKVTSVTWDGYLSTNLNNGWSLSSDGSLYFTHRNLNDLYETSQPVFINNLIKENVLSGKVQVSVSKQFNDSHSIFADISASYYVSHIDYDGSNEHTNKFNEVDPSFCLGYQYYSSRFTAYSHVGMAYEWDKDNNLEVNTLYPYAVVSLNYNPNQKHRFQFWTQYSVFSCGPSMHNPTLVRVNDMMYVKGNPEIKPYGRFEITGTYGWSPVPSILSFTGIIGYEYRPDRYIPVYLSMPDTQAVTSTYRNQGNSQLTYAVLSMNIDLIKGYLSFTTSQRFNFYRPSESYLPNINQRYGTYRLVGYWKNFNIRINYFGNSKKYDSEEMWNVIKIKPSYSFIVGYGDGNWNASVTLWNIFNSSSKYSETWVYSPVYEAHDTNYNSSRKRALSVNVSYTFGYGKKINRGNQLSSDVSSAGSAVMH